MLEAFQLCGGGEEIGVPGVLVIAGGCVGALGPEPCGHMASRYR